MSNYKNFIRQLTKIEKMTTSFKDLTVYKKAFEEEIGRMIGHMMQYPEKYRGNIPVKK